MKVNTVSGQIDTKDLGFTLMHEHIINIDWCWVKAFKDFYDEESVVKMFCEEAAELKALGVKTFVDATPISLGRDIDLLRKCAERAEINIIACTGLYWTEAPFYHWNVTPQTFADYMIYEYEHGMEGTDSKPAFLKCASMADPGETKINECMLRGIAIAHKATGLPVYTHTDPFHPIGLWQKKIFEEEGVDMTKVAFGHAFGLNKDYNEELFSGGSFVGNDQAAFVPDEKMPRAASKIVDAVNRGRVKQIFISTDSAVRSDFGNALTDYVRDREKNSLVKNHQRIHSLFEVLIPELKKQGLSDEDLNEIFVNNPRRYFGEEL